jgi:hypothetical protein
LLVLATLACTRPQPIDSATPDPSTKPLPAPTPTPSPTPAKPSEPVLGHICEPTVRCGVWSGCVWLEKLAGDRYRASGGSEKGVVFVRRHECWKGSCAVFCTGADGGAPCVDGLHPEDETCTGAAVPAPNSKRCSLGDGICGSLM